MKILIWLMLSIYGLNSWAYSCPADVNTNPNAKAVFAWMSRFQGKQNMRGCYVEITVCDPNEAHEGGAVIGEIYIVDDKQREAYLPLTTVNGEAGKIKTSIEAYNKNFYYIKFDYYFEPEFGRSEAYRLDLHLDPSGQYLKSLALGTYATRKKIHSPSGNRSRWYNCGDSN